MKAVNDRPALRFRHREAVQSRGVICSVAFAIMTKLLEEAMREVQLLSADDQNAAAGALLDYIKYMRDLALTDDQLEEVRQRRSNPNRKVVSHAEARERIGRLGT
jgi:hypothetical protein